jgi:putative NADH-flavin reductase
MQITVFGASGKVGALVVEEALRRGYTVVAFVHNHSLFSPSGKLIICKGDVYNASDVAGALEGSNAVISCLSSWGTKGRDVLSRFVSNVVPAMVDQKITRIVTLTGIGVELHPSRLHITALKMLYPLPAGKVFWDAETHVHLLGDSGLDWTAVCSPVMNNFGGAGYRLNERIGKPLATVSRVSVAVALLDQIDATDSVGKTLVIHRR